MPHYQNPYPAWNSLIYDGSSPSCYQAQSTPPLLVIHDHTNIPPALCMTRHNIARVIHNTITTSAPISNINFKNQNQICKWKFMYSNQVLKTITVTIFASISRNPSSGKTATSLKPLGLGQVQKVLSSEITQIYDLFWKSKDQILPEFVLYPRISRYTSTPYGAYLNQEKWKSILHERTPGHFHQSAFYVLPRIGQIPLDGTCNKRSGGILLTTKNTQGETNAPSGAVHSDSSRGYPAGYYLSS